MNYLQNKIENEILIFEFTVATILDPLALESVWQELTETLEFSDIKKVVIDFSSIEFASSGLLGVLLSVRSQSRASGFSLKIAGLSDGMKRVFSVIEIDQLFAIYRSQRSAIESFNAESFVVRQERFDRNRAAKLGEQNAVAVPIAKLASLSTSPQHRIELRLS